VKKKSLNSENNEEKVETRGRKSILTEIQKTTLRRMTENPNPMTQQDMGYTQQIKTSHQLSN
jgi:hypothetical protein